MRFSTISTLIACLILMTLAAGCGTDSAQRVALLEQAVGQASVASASLDQKVEAIELIVTATREAMADPNLGLIAANEFSETLGSALDALNEIGPIKAKTDAVLQGLEVRLAEVRAEGPIDLSDEIALVAGGLAATSGAVGGKAGVYMALAASILGTIGGLIPGARIAKAAKAKQTTAEIAVVQIVRGVDKALASGAVGAGPFLEVVGKKQTEATRALVDRAQGKSAA